MTVRPTVRRCAPQAYQCKIIQSAGMATQIQLEVIFGGKLHSHPHLAKQRQLKSQQRRQRKAEMVSVSVLSKVLSSA